MLVRDVSVGSGPAVAPGSGAAAPPTLQPSSTYSASAEKTEASYEKQKQQQHMSSRRQTKKVTLAIHGGAGGTITPDIPPALQQAYRSRLRAALEAGYAVLRREDGNALDAVCAAVKVLEDSPLFNAGKGAVFTKEGKNELEASVMVSQPVGSPLLTESGLPRFMHGNDWFERGCPEGSAPAPASLPSSAPSSDLKPASSAAAAAQSFDTTKIPRSRRCAAATLVRNTKNPILLARTLYLSPEEAPHVLLAGAEAEQIGFDKGCTRVPSEYYWTHKRWK